MNEPIAEPGNDGAETPLLDEMTGAHDDGADDTNPSGNPDVLESISERVQTLETELEVQRNRAETYEGRYRAQLRNQDGDKPDPNDSGVSPEQKVFLDRSRADREWVKAQFKEQKEVARLSRYMDETEAQKVYELIEFGDQLDYLRGKDMEEQAIRRHAQAEKDAAREQQLATRAAAGNGSQADASTATLPTKSMEQLAREAIEDGKPIGQLQKEIRVAYGQERAIEFSQNVQRLRVSGVSRKPAQ